MNATRVRNLLMEQAMEAYRLHNVAKARQNLKNILFLSPADEEALRWLEHLRGVPSVSGEIAEEPALREEETELGRTEPVLRQHRNKVRSDRNSNSESFFFGLWRWGVTVTLAILSVLFILIGCELQVERPALAQGYGLRSTSTVSPAAPVGQGQESPVPTLKAVQTQAERSGSANMEGTGTQTFGQRVPGAGTEAGQATGEATQTSVAGKQPDEPRLVLISALWRYSEANGSPPSTLGELVPQYLDRIPEEPSSGSSQVVAAQTATGGWIYSQPNGAADPQELVATVRPNTAGTGSAIAVPIIPITLRAHQTSKTLEVWSGDRLVRRYSIGTGPTEYTPFGTHRVAVRSALSPISPDGAANPFGSRWLGFDVAGEAGDYGIHGVADEDLIGGEGTLGCLVLNDLDLRELYDLVPTGTPITIDNF